MPSENNPSLKFRRPFRNPTTASACGHHCLSVSMISFPSAFVEQAAILVQRLFVTRLRHAHGRCPRFLQNRPVAEYFRSLADQPTPLNIVATRKTGLSGRAILRRKTFGKWCVSGSMIWSRKIRSSSRRRSAACRHSISAGDSRTLPASADVCSMDFFFVHVHFAQPLLACQFPVALIGLEVSAAVSIMA